MIRRLALCILIASPNLAFAVDKTILELQRDVALLADQVKQLQQSQDRQMSALQTLVQQSIDASNRADKAVAVIQSSFQQNGDQLKNQVVGPVVGLSTRMDQVSGDVRTLQQAVADLTSAMSKLSAQLSDINNMMKVLSAPPAAPPPQTSGPGGPGSAPASALPPMSQTDLFNAANGDYNSGKLDLALQEFQDFLKYYGNADMAPVAQYWIGQIYYTGKNYDAASQAFDLVLEKYSKNVRTKDAMFYKGMSLVALNKRSMANDVFQQLMKEYAGTDTATRACTEVKSLGMNCPKPGASAAAHRKK